MEGEPSGDGIRADMVATAVRFLQNPRVQVTPVDQQRAFLQKKGLAETEIDAALAQAGASPALPPPPIPAPQGSPWSSYATTAVLVGGGSWAAYRLIRRFILPTFFGLPDPETERMAKMEEQLNEVGNSLKFVMDSVQQTLSSVQGQQESLQRALGVLADKRERDGTATKADVAELRSELAVLRSLLLSRQAFAPLPAPDIPAWQRPKPEDVPKAAEEESSGSDSGTTDVSNA